MDNVKGKQNLNPHLLLVSVVIPVSWTPDLSPDIVQWSKHGREYTISRQTIVIDKCKQLLRETADAHYQHFRCVIRNEILIIRIFGFASYRYFYVRHRKLGSYNTFVCKQVISKNYRLFLLHTFLLIRSIFCSEQTPERKYLHLNLYFQTLNI